MRGLPKTQRKEALHGRALAYAERLKREQETTPVNVVMNAYEDGYRAAMRDAYVAGPETETEIAVAERPRHVASFLIPPGTDPAKLREVAGRIAKEKWG